MSIWHKIIEGTSINLVGMIISTIINFTLVVLVINHFGFEANGYIVLINLLGITGLIGLLDLSIPFISSRVFSKYRSKSKKFNKVIFSFYSLVLFLISILCLILSVIIIELIQPEYKFIFLLVAFSYPILFHGLIAKAYFLSRKNFLLIQLLRLTTDFFRISGFFYVKDSYGLEIYLNIYLLSLLIPTIYLSIRSIHNIGLVKLRVRLILRLIKELLLMKLNTI